MPHDDTIVRADIGERGDSVSDGAPLDAGGVMGDAALPEADVPVFEDVVTPLQDVHDVTTDTLVSLPDSEPDGVADATESKPPPNTVTFLVAEDAWELGVSTPSVIPEEGHGWVTGLDVPAAGTLIGFQAMMGAPFGSPTCGLYRAALWFPFGDDGAFADYPSWVSSVPVAMNDTDAPSVWLLLDPPEVPEGPVRFGLIVDQLCSATSPRPALLSDTSGETDDTWLYTAEVTGVALVPAGAFGVAGRWVLRALVEVEI